MISNNNNSAATRKEAAGEGTGRKGRKSREGAGVLGAERVDEVGVAAVVAAPVDGDQRGRVTTATARGRWWPANRAAAAAAAVLVPPKATPAEALEPT